ncbi:MAG TPA: GAF domain-containing protein [Thermoleophilaceae bacterium]|jgi:signal transduction histidine kinase
MGNGVLSPQVGTLDVFVELFSEIESETEPGEFYNRLCEAVCRLTTMQRAVLMLYDESLGRVVAAGSHGIDPSLLVDVHGTLDETPVAQRAFASDEVQELSPEQLESEIPARYKGVLQVTTLTCTPLSAGKRWFGVIFADRGGGRFKLTDDERHTMWTLGKLAALAASARIATRQQERAQRLYERISLAREVHERVMHRLFGVSLVLSAEVELAPEDRERCRSEMKEALADLRTALERTLSPRPRTTGTTLRAELDRLERGYGDVPVTIEWEGEPEVPERVEALSQATLGESLRNAVRHASPTAIDIRVTVSDETFSLEVVNDGVNAPSAGTGMGLRLASLEALQIGGVVEFGAAEKDRWRTRLVVPL